MSIHICKCNHKGIEEWHLRYPSMEEKNAQSIADKINSGALNNQKVIERLQRDNLKHEAALAQDHLTIERLTAELAAAKKDAERYRWLRDKSHKQYKHPLVVSQRTDGVEPRYLGPLCLDALDSAIDAALTDKQAKE